MEDHIEKQTIDDSQSRSAIGPLKKTLYILKALLVGFALLALVNGILSVVAFPIAILIEKLPDMISSPIQQLAVFVVTDQYVGGASFLILSICFPLYVSFLCYLAALDGQGVRDWFRQNRDSLRNIALVFALIALIPATGSALISIQMFESASFDQSLFSPMN